MYDPVFRYRLNCSDRSTMFIRASYSLFREFPQVTQKERIDFRTKWDGFYEANQERIAGLARDLNTKKHAEMSKSSFGDQRTDANFTRGNQSRCQMVKSQNSWRGIPLRNCWRITILLLFETPKRSSDMRMEFTHRTVKHTLNKKCRRILRQRKRSTAI